MSTDYQRRADSKGTICVLLGY